MPRILLRLLTPTPHRSRQRGHAPFSWTMLKVGSNRTAEIRSTRDALRRSCIRLKRVRLNPNVVVEENEEAAANSIQSFIQCMVLVGARYMQDRKSTRLNSSHVAISYAVFCLKKKT